MISSVFLHFSKKPRSSTTKNQIYACWPFLFPVLLPPHRNVVVGTKLVMLTHRIFEGTRKQVLARFDIQAQTKKALDSFANILAFLSSFLGPMGFLPSYLRHSFLKYGHMPVPITKSRLNAKKIFD